MRMGEVDLIPARSLPLRELAALFNLAYSDYSVPLALDEDGLGRFIADNDLDLQVSRVAMAPEPVAFALIGRRGREAWLGGMGTVPDFRRRGFAERTLYAALQAASEDGAEAVRLEVLEENRSAMSLYTRLGFEVTRRLIVCSLRDLGVPPADWRPMDVEEARSWIAERRLSREPWQRGDALLARMTDSERPLAAVGVSDSSGPAAALVYSRGPGGTSVLQMAARDEAAAVSGLRATAAAAGEPVLLLNFPSDEPIAAGVTRLGVRPEHIQFEMQKVLEA